MRCGPACVSGMGKACLTACSVQLAHKIVIVWVRNPQRYLKMFKNPSLRDSFPVPLLRVASGFLQLPPASVTPPQCKDSICLMPVASNTPLGCRCAQLDLGWSHCTQENPLGCPAPPCPTPGTLGCSLLLRPNPCKDEF